MYYGFTMLASFITGTSQAGRHDLASHLTRACLMLAQAGFPSSLDEYLSITPDVLANDFRIMLHFWFSNGGGADATPIQYNNLGVMDVQ
ncbi:hypothetical protein Tco_0277772 [Tanacetum coccineum]